MRVFLDTNVLVAAFATRGLCADVLRVVLAEHELLVGETVLEEFERVLVEKLGMPSHRARDTSAFVRQNASVSDPAEPASWPDRDPDDRWVIAGALAGNAEVLVTGDRELLEAAAAAPLPVISPRSFWEGLR